MGLLCPSSSTSAMPKRVAVDECPAKKTPSAAGVSESDAAPRIDAAPPYRLRFHQFRPVARPGDVRTSRRTPSTSSYILHGCHALPAATLSWSPPPKGTRARYYVTWVGWDGMREREIEWQARERAGSTGAGRARQLEASRGSRPVCVIVAMATPATSALGGRQRAGQAPMRPFACPTMPCLPPTGPHPRRFPAFFFALPTLLSLNIRTSDPPTPSPGIPCVGPPPHARSWLCGLYSCIIRKHAWPDADTLMEPAKLALLAALFLCVIRILGKGQEGRRARVSRQHAGANDRQYHWSGTTSRPVCPLPPRRTASHSSIVTDQSTACSSHTASAPPLALLSSVRVRAGGSSELTETEEEE
nr:unnamed protein product [Digitaria exilis]